MATVFGSTLRPSGLSRNTGSAVHRVSDSTGRLYGAERGAQAPCYAIWIGKLNHTKAAIGNCWPARRPNSADPTTGIATQTGPCADFLPRSGLVGVAVMRPAAVAVS